MPVEFIGMIGTKDQSEIRNTPGPVIDRDYVRRFSRAHEDAGFDRVLIGYASSQPDGTQVAAYAAAHTERLGFLVAHRPGFVAPTLAARTFATLDQFTGGRIAVHVITGGNDAEQRHDGDFLAKDERYARTDEYLDILKLAWTSDQRFSYEGKYYRVEDFASQVKSPQKPRIRLYFGGSSAAAYRVGGKHADTYALWGEPLAETKQQIDSVNQAARDAGRTGVPGISVSFRPILGPTEELAWERAHRILEVTKENIGEFRKQWGMRTWPLGGDKPENVGSQRLLAAAAKGELHDRALWTPLAAATGAGGNSTALVGTPETVAQALLDYVDIGVTTLLIRGYDPYDDAIDYGRYVLPLVREEVARRDAERAAADKTSVEAVGGEAVRGESGAPAAVSA
jgi:alkanesulfonate monooxygenase